jgi:hypothetical protein
VPAGRRCCGRSTASLRRAPSVVRRRHPAAHGADGPAPIAGTAGALDPALWFYGKWGCTFCERAGRAMPIHEACGGLPPVAVAAAVAAGIRVARNDRRAPAMETNHSDVALNLGSIRYVELCRTDLEGEAGMKRVLLVLVIAALALLGPISGAWAQTHPSQGDNSTGRNDAGFGGGPHCHLLVVDSAQTAFDNIRVFPSHTGHAHSGLSGGVFVADADCDGLP